MDFFGCSTICSFAISLFTISLKFTEAPFWITLSFTLKVFGGFLSIDDFRKGLITDHGPLNMDGIVNSVEFIKEQRAPILNSIKMDQICASSGTNEQLRLKRPKPLKRDDNNLEKTLGITRKKVVT